MIVFSSPTAKKRSGSRPPVVAAVPDMWSQTPWWRLITSTGGTVPSAKCRFGAMRTIQPSTAGFGMPAKLYAMLFCPAFTSIGPNSKCWRAAAVCVPVSAMRLVSVTRAFVAGFLAPDPLLDPQPAARRARAATTTMTRVTRGMPVAYLHAPCRTRRSPAERRRTRRKKSAQRDESLQADGGERVLEPRRQQLEAVQEQQHAEDGEDHRRDQRDRAGVPSHPVEWPREPAEPKAHDQARDAKAERVGDDPRRARHRVPD